MRNDPLTRDDPQENTRRRRVRAQLFGLSAEQVDRIRPFVPQETVCKRVDDRKVSSSVIHVPQEGRRWVDAPAADGPHKTLYNHCRHW